MTPFFITFCVLSYVVVPIVLSREVLTGGDADTGDYVTWIFCSIFSPIIAMFSLWWGFCKLANKGIDKIINQLKQQSDEK